jgi:hypothetical protein
MGLYTIHNEPWIDQQISFRVDEIVKVLTGNLPNIDSIILTGGFGKGEGSVRISGDTVVPLRDFDFVVIFKRSIPRESVNRVEKLLNSVSNENSDYKYNQEFSIDINATTLKNINLFPDIMTYDLKQSKVVYGQDLRSEIKWDSKDIPLRSGVRLLFQKATALVGSFSSESLNSTKDPFSSDIFLREISKVYVEISGALCVLAGKYDSRCMERVKILKEIFDSRFSDLKETVPDLIEKMTNSAMHKVDPYNFPIKRSLVDFWFTARDDLLEVTMYYLREYFGILSTNDLVQFVALLEKNMMKNYYLPLIENYLCTKNLNRFKFLQTRLNSAYNLKKNIDYSILASREHHFSLSLVNGISAPDIKLFSACLLTLFAINKNGSIDDNNLNSALKRLSFVKLDDRGYQNNWDIAKYKCLKLLSLLPPM